MLISGPGRPGTMSATQGVVRNNKNASSHSVYWYYAQEDSLTSRGAVKEDRPIIRFTYCNEMKFVCGWSVTKKLKIIL